MEKNRFYVTTAIDYTNDVIHIGHAYQKVLADVLARYHRLVGDKTFFLTGTDEHGSTSEQAAKKAGKEPKEFVDEISTKDKEQLDALNVSYSRFIRTTDPDHQKAVQEFYLKVKKNGDIYKSKYTGRYCVSCESFKTEREIINGRCEIHQTRELETVSEENWFFKWEKYQNFLREHIQQNPDFVQPQKRRHEVQSFLELGLEDIPISRRKEKVGWGIPVPDDPDQVIYVWFDALINYISGAPDFWPADVHIIGKDNLRWHALLWPAMLKSAGYELPKTVYAHGFLSLEGKKISKTLGNVIRPTELIEKFSPKGNRKLGADVIRHYLIKFGPQREDADLSVEKIKETYNADLANGLGNLVSRISKLAEGETFNHKDGTTNREEKVDNVRLKIGLHLSSLQFAEALSFIWGNLSELDRYINDQKIWEKDNKERRKDLEHLIPKLLHLNYFLEPFLPETSQKIKEQFSGKVKAAKPLFPRLT